MHVALIAAEATPVAKVGGLADVVSSLASALQTLGVRVTMILPGYPAVLDLDLQPVRTVSDLQVSMGETTEPVDIYEGLLPGTSVRILVLRHDALFARSGIYTHPKTGLEYADNARRYAYLCRAATHALAALEQTVDVLHLNDHHTALAVAFARHDPQVAAFFSETGIVFSIHNLGYQGIHELQELRGFGLPEAWSYAGGVLEFWGKLNFMKLGIELSDVITTVSPGYAREIQENSFHGFGLEGVLQRRSNVLFGILNGIDLNTWDPQSDPDIPARFSVEDMAPKQKCKTALRNRLGLSQTDTPLFGIISRLAAQKGIDLLLQAMPRLLQRPLQLVFLGAGDAAMQSALQGLSLAHPSRVAGKIGFDEPLAHQIEAGCDFFLMPSRYEPCGLNQMYSQRYGTMPVARRTGGLADTIKDWQPALGKGTGFLFDEMYVDSLLEAVDRALVAFRSPADLAQLRRNAMSEDFSWERSARQYMEVYDVSRRINRLAPKVAAPKKTHRDSYRGH